MKHDLNSTETKMKTFLCQDAKGQFAYIEWPDLNLPWPVLWNLATVFNCSSGQFFKNRNGLSEEDLPKDAPAAYKDTTGPTHFFEASNGFSTQSLTDQEGFQEGTLDSSYTPVRQLSATFKTMAEINDRVQAFEVEVLNACGIKVGDRVKDHERANSDLVKYILSVHKDYQPSPRKEDEDRST